MSKIEMQINELKELIRISNEKYEVKIEELVQTLNEFKVKYEKARDELSKFKDKHENISEQGSLDCFSSKSTAN